LIKHIKKEPNLVVAEKQYVRWWYKYNQKL